MAAKESIYIDKQVNNQFYTIIFQNIIQKNAEKKILDLGSVPNDLIENYADQRFFIVFYFFNFFFQHETSLQKARRRTKSTEKLRSREQTGFRSVHGLFRRARKVKQVFLSILSDCISDSSEDETSWTASPKRSPSL